MHYQIGQNVVGSYKILSIVHEDERILINVVNDKDEVYIWKSFTSAVPISIEHNIDF